MWIDSHCHLHFSDFQDDLQSIVEKASQAGVNSCLTISTREDTIPEVLKVAEQFSNIYATVGIHPHECTKTDSTQIRTILKNYTKHPKIVGLGETGLDFSRNPCNQNQQIACFSQHLELSKELNLPVVIHTREAETETIKILKEYAPLKGVLHCFTGSPWLLEEALKLDLFISLSGIITFKNAQNLQDLVKNIPLNRLLLETDSPYLAPHPHRGQRNEPAFLIYTAQKIAELKKIELAEISKMTTINFNSLFFNHKT